MRRFFVTLWLVLKGASVQFAAIIPAMVGFHLVGHFIYHSTPAWLPGCVGGLAIAGALWLWIFSRAEEPFLRTFTTLAISTVLWFCLLIAVFRARSVFDHRASIAQSDVLVLFVSGAVVLWLRHVLIRRNEETDRSDRHDHQG
jgi:hypothetical protein